MFKAWAFLLREAWDFCVGLEARLILDPDQVGVGTSYRVRKSPDVSSNNAQTSNFTKSGAAIFIR